MSCFDLSVSTLFLLLPIFLYMIKTNHDIYEVILVILLFINVIISYLFWYTGTEHSILHIYDGIFAKISYLCFSIYIFFIKKIESKLKFISFLLLFISSILFYYSNQYSKQKWCSQKHVIFHSMFHFVVSIGTSIAFLKPISS